jgi:uncharacterized protein YcgI (DUF1989 family)
VLRVVDPLGEQVSDLFAFDEHDHECRLSSGRSLDYAGRIYLTTGDILYANNSKPMFTIMQDTVGLHDDIQHLHERQGRSAGKGDGRCAHVKVGRLH